MKSLLLVFFLFSFISCHSQQHLTNTLSFNENTVSPKATLEDVKWLAGHWRGNAFGGITEELWTPPLGRSMMGSFKLVVENEIQFYELETISEIDQTLILQLKHFHSDLKGWEEKDETIDFKLVKVTDNKVYFDGFTLEKVSQDEINMYVVIEDDGHASEVKFNYLRVK